MPTAHREYPERPLVGVGGVVIANDRALLVRRGQSPLKGEWSIPGGVVESGETLIEAVARELAEETGIEARPVELIEVFERIELDAAGKARYHFVVLDYLCELTGGEMRAGSDATEAAWAAEAELARYSLAPATAQVVQKAFQKARERKNG